jgi:hypothetical protein
MLKMKDELTFDDLALIAGGHAAFQLFWAGHQLGVFAALAQNPGLDKSELIKKAGLEKHPGRILLTGLTALRLIIKDGNTYRNSLIVDKLCVPNNPESMIDVLGWQYHIVYPGLMNFVESLKQNRNVGLDYFPGEGKTLYERLTYNPTLEKIFQDAMSSLSRSANKVLTEIVDFSGISHLVDAGGGDATNALVLAAANPAMRVTVFDSPSVCKIANTKISASNMNDRVGTYSGDFFVDDFPSGMDCVLFAHILTIWSLEKNEQLLRRTHDYLPTGGKVMIFNMMANDNEDGPISTALGSPYFLAIATGEGALYAWKDYESLIVKAGFRQVERLELPKNHGLIVGMK